MAQVLAPIVQTTGTITMPYSPSDGYKNAPSQHHQSQQRGSQMPRNQSNGHPSGTGYRGTSAPIAPYAFSSTPGLRQDTRSVSAPLPQGTQQPPSHLNQSRLGHPSHPSSSSDSTVSTSGSSNRSLANPAYAPRDGENRKPGDSAAPQLPDLSFSVGDAPVKPSPGRYRRSASRTDSSTSIPTGASTPTQRTVAAAPAQTQPAASGDPSGITRPGHNRASSADDSQLAQTGGSDAAKRYRRRSFNGLEADTLTANMTSMKVGPAAAQNTTTTVTSSNLARPASSSSRQGSRPASGHSHDRQGSAGSVSSNNSSRSQVSLAVIP